LAGVPPGVRPAPKGRESAITTEPAECRRARRCHSTSPGPYLSPAGRLPPGPPSELRQMAVTKVMGPVGTSPNRARIRMVSCCPDPDDQISYVSGVIITKYLRLGQFHGNLLTIHIILIIRNIEKDQFTVLGPQSDICEAFITDCDN
jgi:hypothetical protein